VRRPSYRAAIKWLATSDTTWVIEGRGPSIAAALVADIFGVLDSRVRADVVRALGREKAYVPNSKAAAS
jgi:hypothetical protein